MMSELATVFKALGDKTRLDILGLLKTKDLCVCDILDAFSHSQPAISHHLKILRQAGLVNDKREGKWLYYSLNPETFAKVQAFAAENAQLREIEHVYPQSNNALK